MFCSVSTTRFIDFTQSQIQLSFTRFRLNLIPFSNLASQIIILIRHIKHLGCVVNRHIFIFDQALLGSRDLHHALIQLFRLERRLGNKISLHTPVYLTYSPFRFNSIVQLTRSSANIRLILSFIRPPQELL